MTLRKLSKEDRIQRKRRLDQARQRLAELRRSEALFECWIFVIASDGPATDREVRYLWELIAKRQIADAPNRTALRKRIETTGSAVLGRAVSAGRRSSLSTLASKRTLIHDLFDLSASDGSITPEEEEAVEIVARLIQLPPKRLDRMRRAWNARNLDPNSNCGGEKPDQRSRSKKHTSSTGTPWYYEYLGCTHTDSDATVKRRYRALAAKLHPDKHVACASAADIAHYIQRFQRLQSAYDLIRKHRTDRRS